MYKESDRDRLRMIEWLAVAAMLFAASSALLMLGINGPYQTLLWKLGLVTLGGFVGYRLDRAAFRDRISIDSHPLIMIRRAIVMLAAIYGLGAAL